MLFNPILTVLFARHLSIIQEDKTFNKNALKYTNLFYKPF